MKAIALFVAGFCVCLVATAARADNLHLTPAHPAIGQYFTIDVDYVTTCNGSIGDVTATLQPPDPVFDFVRVNIGSAISCFDRVDAHVVHLSATMEGLAGGHYPIYSAVGIVDGLDPPFEDTQLQGNVTVGPTGENLQLAPSHPAVGQSFTIDVDYVTSCPGPIGDVSAILRPPIPGFDFARVNIETEIECFGDVDFHAVHLSATMPGLAAGSYPIYYAVTYNNGYTTPYLETRLLGNVTVGPAGSTGATAAPTLSTWASIVLALVLGIAAMKEKGVRDN